MFINGDFRDVLPLVEPRPIVISDPPYNIDFKYGSYRDNKSEIEYIEMIRAVGSPAVLIHYPEETMRYFVPALGVPSEVITWCYNSNVHRQSRLISFWGVPVRFDSVRQPYKNPDDSRVFNFGNLEGTSLYDWFSDIQQVKNVSGEKTDHPCQVPVKLMERIILLCTNPGDMVFDPFMGSGTTAIAAERTGRRWSGSEIDPEYFSIAKNRIEKESHQVKLL